MRLVQSIRQVRVKGTEPPADFKRKGLSTNLSAVVAFQWTIRHNTGPRGLTWSHLAFAAARPTTSRTHGTMPVSSVPDETYALY